jgi:hypothetical protein
MENRQVVKEFHRQAGLDEDADLPLEFSAQFSEVGYRVPREVGLDRDPCGDDVLVLKWLDVAKMHESVSGDPGPPVAGCLIEFLSLGIDRRWEGLVRWPGIGAVTPRRADSGEQAGIREQSEAHEQSEAYEQAEIRETDAPELAAAQEVLEFARRRGPLGIWPFQVSMDVGERAFRLSEPVAYYWGLARKMRTLLRLAQYLRGYPADRPSQADVYDLLGRVPEWGEAGLKGELAGIVTRWLRFAGPHPAVVMSADGVDWQHKILLPDWEAGFDWDAQAEHERKSGKERLQPGRRHKSLSALPREDQRVSPVFAVLVMQLATHMVWSRGCITCRICQRLFEPSRKPRADRASPTCGRTACKKGAHNLVQNASNRKKREKASLVQ